MRNDRNVSWIKLTFPDKTVFEKDSNVHYTIRPVTLLVFATTQADMRII